MITHIPSGYTKIRAVRKLEYARESFEPGRILVIDSDTANKLIKSKHAEAVEDGPARKMIATSCPKCGSAMEYVAEPEAAERWTQCKNPQCNLGWLR